MTEFHPPTVVCGNNIRMTTLLLISHMLLNPNKTKEHFEGVFSECVKSQSIYIYTLHKAMMKKTSVNLILPTQL